MNFAQINSAVNRNHLNLQNPALFTLVETDTNYLVAIDIPNLPTEHSAIIQDRNQLTVESACANSIQNQIAFRWISHNHNVEIACKDGLLWLVLPKTNLANVIQTNKMQSAIN